VSTWVVILAGGVGSRFWPLSTARRPKQLLPLVGTQPLLADTLERMAPLAPPSRTLILTNASLVPSIRALAPDIPADLVVAEPRPAGTAAALTWAAALIASRDGPEATMLSVHADWAVRDPDGYRATMLQAAKVAEDQRMLVTVGVIPTRADPGFGYIRPGDPLPGADPRVGARLVKQFVEKPSRERAEEMRREGCLWNSGIFTWRVGDFLEEVRAHCREVGPALETAHGDAERFFSSVKVVAVDVGVLERSSRVAVIPGDFGWDDIGTWAALRRVRALDSSGNAVSGPVHLVASRNNVVHSEGNDVVLYGVSDLVVVTHHGLTLITTMERSADLKELLEALPPHVRERP
jgi:mannose-1-phosphate guanylyltransferase